MAGHRPCAARWRARRLRAVAQQRHDVRPRDDRRARPRVARTRCCGGTGRGRRRRRTVVAAGTTVDWRRFRLMHRKTMPSEPAVWPTDLFEGRGTLVPMRMIRVVGNIDRDRLPHYAADYEFSNRLKRHGFRLLMTNRTTVRVRLDETALASYDGPTSLKRLWFEATSKRSYRATRPSSRSSILPVLTEDGGSSRSDTSPVPSLACCPSVTGSSPLGRDKTANCRCLCR